MRSLAAAGLAGGLAGSIHISTVAAGVVVVGGLLLAHYRTTRETDPGLTTELAALVVFLLGAVAWSRPAPAAAMAVVMAVLLVEKEPLHHFTRELISEVEVVDALKLFVAAIVVLPLLPDRHMGPYGVLNPHRIWVLVVAVTGIGWAGYVAVRLLGQRRGLLVTGLAGGFISGTATTGAMARRGRDPGYGSSALAAALLTSAATMVQLVMVLGIANRTVMGRMLPALGGAGLVLVLEAIVVGRHTAGPDDSDSGVGRPFALAPAVLLAAVLTSALILARWAEDVAGAGGAQLAATLTGFADVHAAGAAIATLADAAAITVDAGAHAVGLAVLANTLVKCALALAIGGRRWGSRFVALLLAPGVAFAVGLTLAG